MPIHDVGYRRWIGQLSAIWTRWWVIAESGIKMNMKSRWLRRALMLAWIPVLAAGGAVFAFEKSLEQWRRTKAIQVNLLVQEGFPREDAERRVVQMLFRGLEDSPLAMFPGLEHVQDAFVSGDDNLARSTTWSWLLMNFFRYPQGTLLLLVVGLIAPPLIAQDVRSRAFQLYYARPIGRLEYVFGKLVIPSFFVALITTVPALALYFFGLLMSPDLSVIGDTWHIPFRVLFASITLIVPTCCLALMLSSLTHESRFAGFAWFTVWGLGMAAWGVIFMTRFAIFEERMSDEAAVAMAGNCQWTLLSLYNTLGRVQGWIFGLGEPLPKVLPSMGMLLGITLFSLFVLYKRVSAPIRV